jgi:hypothetical protein
MLLMLSVYRPPYQCAAARSSSNIDATDGYRHYGAETGSQTADLMLGIGPETVVRVMPKSWTCHLDADPGPARISSAAPI